MGASHNNGERCCASFIMKPEMFSKTKAFFLVFVPQEEYSMLFLDRLIK